MIIRKKEKLALFGLCMVIFCTAAFFGWQKLHYGFNFMDEGYHMTESWRLAAGDHFLHDKISGALLHYTLINKVIFELFPEITLLGFRQLQFIVTILSLIFLIIAVSFLQEDSWYLPLVLSIIAFTGLNTTGGIPNFFYHTYPHLFITQFLTLFIFGLVLSSKYTRRGLFSLSGLILWLMSLSALYTGIIIISPVVFFFINKRYLNNKYNFNLKDLIWVLAPFFLGWGIFVGVHGQEYIQNIHNSINIVLYSPTHSVRSLLHFNFGILLLLIIGMAVILIDSYLLNRNKKYEIITGLLISSVIIYYIINIPFWLNLSGKIGIVSNIYNCAWACSIFLSSFMILFWMSIIIKILIKQSLSECEQVGIIFMLPATILAITVSIFSDGGMFAVLYTAIPVIVVMGGCIITNLKKRKFAPFYQLIILLLVFAPFYLRQGWFAWHNTFNDFIPSHATTTIDKGFGKGICTNEVYKSVYCWIENISQKYSQKNDYILAYPFSPMVHMIAKRRPALDDTFISFNLKSYEYYDNAIKFMQARSRRPKLAFVFSRSLIVIPIFSDGIKYFWPSKQLDPQSSDPISRYVRDNMVLLNQFTIMGFQMACYIDNNLNAGGNQPSS